jgi:hypothetical protein
MKTMAEIREFQNPAPQPLPPGVVAAAQSADRKQTTNWLVIGGAVFGVILLVLILVLATRKGG